MLEKKDWVYDRADARHKHHWKHDKAGFMRIGNKEVGKCHSSITAELAQELLRTGLRYNAPGSEVVTHVYAVYRGVVYEAAPTLSGRSYHGYPWKGDQGRPPLPPRIERELRRRAEQDGFSKEFTDWLDKHS